MPDLPEAPATASSTRKISVQLDGDTELWAVSGKMEQVPGSGVSGLGWTLPIYVRPFRSDTGERWFRVKRAGSYTASQYRHLKPVLDAFDHCPNDLDAWWFSEASLLKFARKHPGINREAVLVWPGCEPTRVDRGDIDVHEEELEIDADQKDFSAPELEFLKRVHFLLGSIAWDELKIIWLAVRKEAKKFLVTDRRTLDLGFARLAYTPYRQNWKEALCVRFSALLSAFRKPPADRHQTLAEAGVYRALASAKLLAIDPKRRFVHWTLETLPSQELDRALEEQELARFQRLGPAAYANHILSAMSKRLKYTLEILRHYAGAVGVPAAEIREGRTFGALTLIPATDPGRVRPGRGICETLELSPEAAFDKFSDEAPPPAKNEEPKPELPNFLKDIRSFRQLVENGELKPPRGKHDGGVIIDLDAVSPSPDPTQANGS
jgi:hypothetical protein